MPVTDAGRQHLETIARERAAAKERMAEEARKAHDVEPGVPDLGTIVWRREPLDTAGNSVVAGIVVEVDADENGLALITIAQWWSETSYVLHGEGDRRAQAAPKVHLATAYLEDLIVDESRPPPVMVAKAAALIALAVGFGHRNGARWSAEDYELVLRLPELIEAAGIAPPVPPTPLPKSTPGDVGRAIGGTPRWAADL